MGIRTEYGRAERNREGVKTGEKGDSKPSWKSNGKLYSVEIEVIWTGQAEKGLKNTINYLEENWTSREILRLEDNINRFIDRIKQFPYMYPQTPKYKGLRKGMVDKNNYIVYRVYLNKKAITIINFRNSKQAPIY